MPTRDGDKRRVARVPDPRAVCDPVCEIPQSHARGTALDLLRDDAHAEHVRHEHRVEHEAQRAGQGHFWPGNAFPLGVRLCAVPSCRDPAAVDPQGDARRDMRDDGQEDEQGFERERLVVRPCEEEVFV